MAADRRAGAEVRDPRAAVVPRRRAAGRCVARHPPPRRRGARRPGAKRGVVSVPFAGFANLRQRCYRARMSNTTMNISLPKSLREYVDERVAEGSFANASDYVRALIRDDRAKRATVGLEAKLLEGLASPLEEATEEYWKRLEAEARARISKRKRTR